MMRKKWKRGKKEPNFSEVRYPKLSRRISDMMLPDELFWHVYYGVCSSGILLQFQHIIRWHAIRCLVGIFDNDDAGLLQSRQILIGMRPHVSHFLSEYELVMDNAVFKKREASLNATSTREKANSMCEWRARAGRANLEFRWYAQNTFEQFCDQVSSLPSARMGADLEFTSMYKHKFPMEWYLFVLLQLPDLGLGSRNDAFTLLGDRIKSEMHEMEMLEETHDQEWKRRCMYEFLLFFVRRRALYIEAKPKLAELDDMYGHSNFGLGFEIYAVREKKILERMDS